MNRIAALLCTALGAAACGGSAPPAPAGPALPPLQLRELLPALKAKAAALPEVPPPTQRELRELADLALQLVEADARTSGRAERALREHPAAWWALEPALAHEQPAVRRRAAWLAGESGQTILQLPLLLRLKYESDAETLVWVAAALQQLGNDSGLPWLVAAMDQAATAEAAGQAAVAICRERQLPLAEPPTYAELQQRLREQFAGWQQTGRSPRQELAAPDPQQLAARLAAHLACTEGFQLRPIDEARYVLTRCGALAVPLLAEALRASEPYLRSMALQVLAELGPAGAAAGPQALPLLGDPLTAAYAIRVLGELGFRAALPHLRARLGERDTELRAAAALALGLLRDADSGAALAARLGAADEAIDVRVNAAFARLCLGPDPAAEAYLAEREARGDYHAPTLQRLRERLRAAQPAGKG